MSTPEHQRLQDLADGSADWRKWGPYLSERQWGTVREDYSADGNAWRYFTHDQARSRSYRWGEDGLAGFSDDHQLLCFALGLWNGKDPILKERLFGLGNGEGNHGEAVKERYHYLDALPSYAYAKYLYRYPQAPFPYLDLVAANAARGKDEPPYELCDTGVFAENRYFDVVVEYAKDGPEDILIAVGITNRGPEAAELTVLPTLWFRNTWSWSDDTPKPNLKQVEKKSPTSIIAAVHAELGVRYLYCAGAPQALFTENETNNRRLFGGDNAGRFVKDGINDCVVGGVKGAVNPRRTGTKAAVRYDLVLEPGERRELRLRLADGTPASSDRGDGPFVGFDAMLASRRAEADAFYASLLPEKAGKDGETALILRQACAGLLWNAQFYCFDAGRWLGEHGAAPGGTPGHPVRNTAWAHLDNADVITAPDKWEYPWYAAWNLAFHSLPLALVDAERAKRQLCLLLDSRYLHPNGKLPASEWDFSAPEPPLHGCAVWSVYDHDKARRGGRGDLAFLRQAFPGLLMTFTWWANRVDAEGRDLLSGGLVDVDAIEIFDRFPVEAARIETSTGSAWMAFQCAQMLQIAVELAVEDAAYEPFAVKFFDHLMGMAQAMEHMAGGTVALWDEADGWYYDLVRAEGGSAQTLKARSFAGLVPILACAVLPAAAVSRLPRLEERLRRVTGLQQEGSALPLASTRAGQGERRLVAIVGEARLRKLLARILDEQEFLSPFGVRSLSRAHLQDPVACLLADENEIRVGYRPGEAEDALCAGNVNWRGPVWLPLNALLVNALLQHYLYYGNRLRIECPAGSGQRLSLYEVAELITVRLAALFHPDANGIRPALRGEPALGADEGALLLFHEYFDGDDGTGLGASHQTGWTALIAPLLRLFATTSAAEFLDAGAGAGTGSRERRNAWPAAARV
ncbi:MAG: glucosidase [Rhodospirillales bacterium]|nr:glucosidase [Rhodospirillales bacterium]